LISVEKDIIDLYKNTGFEYRKEITTRYE
jgi:hypothetical protein